MSRETAASERVGDPGSSKREMEQGQDVGGALDRDDDAAERHVRSPVLNAHYMQQRLNHDSGREEEGWMGGKDAEDLAEKLGY